jgi:hypothetical protein
MGRLHQAAKDGDVATLSLMLMEGADADEEEGVVSTADTRCMNECPLAAVAFAVSLHAAHLGSLHRPCSRGESPVGHRCEREQGQQGMATIWSGV